MAQQLDDALKGIPNGLRQPLIKLYEETLSEYRAGRWEAVGTKAGKTCEVVYSIIHGKVSGTYPSKPSKPKNMVDDCKRLEQHNKTHGRSLCIQVPRVLTAVYELRNNRDIGHVGSDVNPNHMDAELMIRAVKWLMAELVRNFGTMNTDEARELIESVTERSFHAVWSEGKTRRVLNTSLRIADKALVLLYASGGKAQLDQLFAWTEHSNKGVFKSQVMKPLHITAMVHIDKSSGEVTLLPPGVRHVEEKGLLSI
jgi:hypothetical protein